jgi:hypothetical protein
MTVRLVWFAVSCVALGCSSETPPAGTKVDSGAAGDSSLATAEDGGADASVDAAFDAEKMDAAEAGPFVVPAACDPGAKYGAGVSLGLGVGQIKQLSAIADDERTIAWITPSDGVVHYADRLKNAVTFTGEQTLDGSALAPGEPVALEPAGLVLYAVASGGRAIVQYARSAPGDALSVAPNLALPMLTVAQLNAQLAAMPPAERLSDLTIGAVGLALVARHVGGQAPGLLRADRMMPSAWWPQLAAFAAQGELVQSGSSARRPSGFSSDARALFYFDELTATAKTAYFDLDLSKASVFVDRGAWSRAQPNRDCSKVYYDAGGDLLVAARL